MTREGSRLAEFIEQTGYENIPVRAIEIAKTAFLDCLGVTLAGSAEVSARKVIEFVKECEGKAESLIVGTNIRSLAPLAALANGTSAHVLDYDDGSRSWIAHPSAVLVPGILAMGERCSRSGREILTAYILGYEIGARIAFVCGHDHYSLGWHNTSTLGSIAAAAAIAKLLRLDKAGIIAAIGIAASQASGLRQNFGTMTKSFHAGHAAHNGIVAGLLAAKGYEASEEGIEGEFGFCRVLGGGRNYDFSALLDSLGTSWDIVSSGLTFKPYPSCRSTHAAIDCALLLRERYNIFGRDVDRIECRTSPIVPSILRFHEAHTGLEGKFCMEYCVAVALHEGNVALKHFAPEALANDGIQELSRKVSYAHPQDAGAEIYAPQEVVVTLRNGKTFSQRCEASENKGGPDNPMTEDEMIAKYRACAALALSPKKVENSLSMILKLESLADVNHLAEVISTSPGL